MAIVGPAWSQKVDRQRERELIRIGSLYARAIANYHDLSPGSAKQYPQRLDELLLDTRFVTTVRHLRALYPDPVNPGQPWGLMRDEAQKIIGVYSQSERVPLVTGGIDAGGFNLLPATRYTDWKFSIRPKE